MPIMYNKEVGLFGSLKELNEYTEGKYKGCFTTFRYGDGTVDPYDEGFNIYTALFGDFIPTGGENSRYMATVLHPVMSNKKIIVLGTLNKNRYFILNDGNIGFTKCGTMHLFADEPPKKAVEIAFASIDPEAYPDWMARTMKWFESPKVGQPE